MSAIPFISAEDVEQGLDWLALTDALLDGHRGAKARIADQMIARGDDVLLSRLAWIEGLGFAAKTVTVVPENTSRRLPSVHGAMLLFDDKTGVVEAVIDSGLVTKWKTAADSLLGARLLARKESRRLLVVGAGVVAETLIGAYRALFPGIAVSVWNRTAGKAQALAAASDAAFAPDLERAVGEADIVACATMAKEPVIRGAWLQPGVHLDLIGAFTPAMREADDEAMRRARVFVDCRETTLDHIGEMMVPLANGTISRADVLGDLVDLAAGVPGRISPQDITLYKNGGGAHLDLMTGRMILAVWKKMRTG